MRPSVTMKSPSEMIPFHDLCALMEKIHKTQGTDKKKKILSSFIERWRETHARLHASHRRGHDENSGGKRPQKIIYVSDGCAAQYKNCKHFLNLCLHLVDFGVPAEWHFFATSHGKSAGDGAGGTLKRLATKASLQHAYKDHILTAHQLYQFAVNSIKGMQFCFVALNEHQQEAKLLEERLARSRTVAGTQKLHCSIPVPANTVEVKLFSCSTVSRREKVKVGRTPVLSPRATAIGGYVTMAYDGESWLGCVVGAHESEHAITVKFLHPCIPAPCFVFPEQEDLLDIDLSDVLTCVNATTATGRTYTLSRKEMQEASVALRARFA
eukprot:Em0140g7a